MKVGESQVGHKLIVYVFVSSMLLARRGNINLKVNQLLNTAQKHRINDWERVIFFSLHL